MNLAFIAEKPSRRFIARITFQSVRILQGISCPVVWSVLYGRGVHGKEVILRILFCLESFQMIANGERKFLPLSLFSQLSQDLLYSFKKSRFVGEVLF